MVSLSSTVADNAEKQASPLKRRHILVFTLLIAIIFFPEELSFYFGTLRLTVARAALILMTPVVFLTYINLISGPELKFTLSDFLFGISGLWMFGAASVMQGWDKALVSSGVLVLEFCATYMAARVLMRRNIEIEAAVHIICIVTSVVALLAILDPIFGYHVVHETSGHLTGYLRPTHGDTRMGFLRASGPMEHPILLGTVCALILILSLSFTSRLRWLVRGCCLAGLVFSFSSGAIGGLLVGLFIFGYNKIFEGRSDRWLLLAALATGCIGIVYLVTSSPLSFVLSHLTFDPESAYFRLIIWQFGGDALMTSPIFGIGVDAEYFREEWLPRTIDCFYLMSALNFGIPGSVLMATSWFSPVLFPATRTMKDDSIDPDSAYRLRWSLNAALVAVMYVGCTVHFWGVIWMLISVLAGLRASLGSQLSPVDKPVQIRKQQLVMQRGRPDSNLPASSL